MKKILQIGNGIAFIAVVFINYLSNTGLLNNTTIGEISRDLNSLFTPAGYAFSIWGLIYLLLLGFAIYQGRSLFVMVKNDEFIKKTGVWFILSCFANAAWIFCWIYEYTGLSCIFIFLLLITILKIVWNNKMKLSDAPFSIRLFLWWPFLIYSGWVAVASIANVSSYLVKIGWDRFGVSAEIWTLIMILIATIINLIITWKKNMIEFAFVGVWALIAIGVANSGNNTIISYSAFFSAAILTISSCAHTFKKRNTSLIKK